MEEIRRHQLIEEAKAELDVVYEEVKRAEGRLFAVEREYGERIACAARAGGAPATESVAALAAEREARKDQIGVSDLHRLEKAALERFSLLTAAFSAVCAVPEPERAAETLGETVFRPGELDGAGDEVRRALRAFVRGLRAWATDEASIENDRQVRESWALIEDRLRDCGRAI